MGMNPTTGDHGYKAFFRGQDADIYAPSLYEAKKRAVAHFKPRKNQEHQVHVYLCEMADGTPVTHVAVD